MRVRYTESRPFGRHYLANWAFFNAVNDAARTSGMRFPLMRDVCDNLREHGYEDGNCGNRRAFPRYVWDVSEFIRGAELYVDAYNEGYDAGYNDREQSD